MMPNEAPPPRRPSKGKEVADIRQSRWETSRQQPPRHAGAGRGQCALCFPLRPGLALYSPLSQAPPHADDTQQPHPGPSRCSIFHGVLTKDEADAILKPFPEGSYLLRERCVPASASLASGFGGDVSAHPHHFFFFLFLFFFFLMQHHQEVRLWAQLCHQLQKVRVGRDIVDLLPPSHCQ